MYTCKKNINRNINSFVTIPDDSNKIIALQKKRKFYIDDIKNIDNKKLRISYIRSGLWFLIIGVPLLIFGISRLFHVGLTQSIINTLTSTFFAGFIAYLNMFNTLQSRKYDDIQKIIDIQYELTLCNDYSTEDDHVKNIDNLIKEYLESLNVQ